MRTVAATFATLGALALARGASIPIETGENVEMQGGYDSFMFDRIRTNLGFATSVMREVARAIDEPGSADLVAHVLDRKNARRAIPRPIWEPTNTFEGTTPSDRRRVELGYPGEKHFVMFNKYGFPPEMEGLPETVTPVKENVRLMVNGDEERKLLSLMSQVREMASALAPAAQIPQPPVSVKTSQGTASWLREVATILGDAMLADLKKTFPRQPSLPYHRPMWIAILTKLREVTTKLQDALIYEKSSEMQRYPLHFLAVREFLREPLIYTRDVARDVAIDAILRSETDDRQMMRSASQNLAEKLMMVDPNLLFEM